MKYISFILGIVMAISLAACSEDSSNTPIPRVDIPMSRAESEIVNTTNSFSLRFFKKVLETENNNFGASPMSLSMALSMTANGASGEALSEILETIGFEAKEIGRAHV